MLYIVHIWRLGRYLEIFLCIIWDEMFFENFLVEVNVGIAIV